MHDRFILLRRRDDLEGPEIAKRDVWLSRFPRLAAAYALKEAFYDLWDAPTKQEAQEQYDAWQAAMPEDLAAPFYDLTTAMSNWREEIFAHFSHGHVTNAYTEAVNGLAKLIARNGRGYSFEAVRAKVLYGNGLKMRKRPKYDRSKDFSEVRMAFNLESLYHPAPVELDHYDSLGNEISTLTQYLEGGNL